MGFLLLTAEHMSLSEILTKALLNTCLGMGTVFVVLIFISWIIGLLKYVPDLADKLSFKKKKPQAIPAPAPLPVAEPKEEAVPEETDDSELVAVITAAVAAAMGTGTDGFVVRSIKRAHNRKW